MSQRLNWERANQKERIRQRGSERANVQSIRATGASDAQIDKLFKLGYRGDRPATSAEAKELIRLWTPGKFGVSDGKLESVLRLPHPRRNEEAAILLRTMKSTWNSLRLRIQGNSALTDRQRRSELLRLDDEYDGQRARL